MRKFFVEYINSDNYLIDGIDAHHIKNVLRMKIGDKLILCDTFGVEHRGIIDFFENDSVNIKINESTTRNNEPCINLTLYQGLPKGSKLDMICQKVTELGCNNIVPVTMNRCVCRIDKNKEEAKISRLQRIVTEAAKQSGRNKIPKVHKPITFEDAIEQSKNSDISMFCYEGGGKKLSDIINKNCKSISIFIGPEGGFSIKEYDMIIKNNIIPITLGKRILRTETASIAAVTLLMYTTGNLE